MCENDEVRAGDISGFCPAEAEDMRGDILSGRINPDAAMEKVHKLNSDEVLYVPLMDEVRIHALGRGILGPGQRIEDWDAGLITAPMWRKDEK